MVQSREILLKSHGLEMVKEYIEYDIYDRPEYVYTSPTDAINGAPCVVTQYVYVADPQSPRVVKMKESETTWNSTWDI